MTLFSLILTSKLEQTSPNGVYQQISSLYFIPKIVIFDKTSSMCQNIFLPLFCFRWLRKPNPGFVSCRKLCFRWLMNRWCVRLSHQKLCFWKIGSVLLKIDKINVFLQNYVRNPNLTTSLSKSNTCSLIELFDDCSEYWSRAVTYHLIDEPLLVKKR